MKLDARTIRQKRQVYSVVASHFVTASPKKIRQGCAELSDGYGIDFPALSDKNALTPAMIREMHASGLVEFGAHSARHAYLGRLDNSETRCEITQSERATDLLTTQSVRFQP